MRRLLLFCLVITIVVVFVPGCQKKSETPEELSQRIISLARESKYDEALTLSDRFIDQYPDVAFGYAAKGNILSSLYRREEALDAFTEALDHLESERDKSAIYINIGLTHFHLNQFEEALQYYDRSMEADSGSVVDNSLRKAMALLVLGKKQEAQELYEHVRSEIGNADGFLNSDYPGNKSKVYEMASWIAFQLDRKEDALDFAGQALSLSPDDDGRVLRAVYLGEFGDTEEAARTFEGTDQKNVSALQVATYYAVVGKTDEAEQHFIKSFEEQGSQTQLANWRREIARDKMFPKDVWKNVRGYEWFRSRAEGK